MHDSKNLQMVSKWLSGSFRSRLGTYTTSTNDGIIPTRFLHDYNACEKPRSNGKDAQQSSDCHGRNDRLIGSVAGNRHGAQTG